MFGVPVTAASFKSFPEMFLHRVSSTPDTEAFTYPDAKDSWQSMQWRDVGERVRAIACGLRSLGIELEQRAAILCSTRVEWVIVDLGISCARAATTTIYPSSTADQVEYIVNDSRTRVVFVEDDVQMEKMVSIRERCPEVMKVINITGRSGHGGWSISLKELEELGRKWDEAHEGAYHAGIDEVESHHLATLIYTSGTTGDPKGVELLHDCWVSEAEAMDTLGFMTPADKQFLWLPLSHSFGKVLEALTIRIGVPTAIDGRLDRIVSNLAEVRPTFVAAVPRIFEKVFNKVVSDAKGSKLKFRVFKWALENGRTVSQLKQRGQQPSGLLALKYAMADKLVFSKLKAKFGGRLRFFISGSAPLSREIAEFFHAADILILEGYGLTESSAASFVNRPDRFKFGTVGHALPGVEVRIEPSDGEILLRGRGIMRGYFNKAEKTAETLHTDTEGVWLRTGDIGELDADGFLRITDRKKDLIKTSGGKYVAPQELEGRLKTRSGLISQVVVHGNRRNFCSALITLDPDALEQWCGDHNLSGMPMRELVAHEALLAEIQAAVDDLNGDLASYETIKKFILLQEDFSIEGGELTPSMKVKRKAVEKKHAEALDALYGGALEEV
ncbi:MAG: long-chain fatty acid--CoA ligase [Deltaproteobacteria bacterium]|nr:long-chain fatty acid--CoA ligase [Deltaproteobacteria bacterium]